MILENTMARVTDHKKKYIICVATWAMILIIDFLGSAMCQMEAYLRRMESIRLRSSMRVSNAEVQDNEQEEMHLSTMAEMIIEGRLDSTLEENEQLYSSIVSERNYIKAQAMLEQVTSNMDYINKTMSTYETQGYFQCLEKDISNSVEKLVNTQKVFKILQDKNVNLLAKGIHGEGSVCDVSEKYCIGTVAANRLERDEAQFGNTLEQILEKGYSSYKDDRWYSEKPTAQEYAIAEDILVNGKRVFPIDVVYQSKEYLYGEIVKTTEWHVYAAEPYNP